ASPHAVDGTMAKTVHTRTPEDQGRAARNAGRGGPQYAVRHDAAVEAQKRSRLADNLCREIAVEIRLRHPRPRRQPELASPATNVSRRQSTSPIGLVSSGLEGVTRAPASLAAVWVPADGSSGRCDRRGFSISK